MRMPEGASYIPVLSKLFNMTLEPIIEIGMGAVSSPYLHWMCFPINRPLVSIENNPRYFKFAKCFESPFHKVICTKDLDSIDLSTKWSIAFVDHGPAERRVEEIKRLVHSEYVVLHDSEEENEKAYNYSSIYPLYKFKWTWKEVKPETTVMSNKRKLHQFTVGWDDPTPYIEEIDPVSDRYMRRVSTFQSPNRPYTICEALGELYIDEPNPEKKVKLRYAATLAQYTLWKLKESSPKWLKDFYPKGKDYRRIMYEDMSS